MHFCTATFAWKRSRCFRSRSMIVRRLRRRSDVVGSATLAKDVSERRATRRPSSASRIAPTAVSICVTSATRRGLAIRGAKYTTNERRKYTPQMPDMPQVPQVQGRKRTEDFDKALVICRTCLAQQRQWECAACKKEFVESELDPINIMNASARNGAYRLLL